MKHRYYAVPSEPKLLGSNLSQSTKYKELHPVGLGSSSRPWSSAQTTPVLLASPKGDRRQGSSVPRSGLQKPNCFYTKHHLTSTSRWTELPSHPGSLSLVLSFDRFRNSTNPLLSSVHPRPRLRRLYIRGGSRHIFQSFFFILFFWSLPNRRSPRIGPASHRARVLENLCSNFFFLAFRSPCTRPGTRQPLCLLAPRPRKKSGQALFERAPPSWDLYSRYTDLLVSVCRHAPIRVPTAPVLYYHPPPQTDLPLRGTLPVPQTGSFPPGLSGVL